MNSIKYFFLILILAILSSGCRKQPREIILRSAIKMDTLKEVTYVNRIYRARDDQKNSNGTNPATAICYFDFDKDVPIMNARYYFNSNSTEYFYDGKKSVNINHNLHHIVSDASPNKFSLLRSYFITYSLHSMKNLLPALIDNPNAELTRSADTTVNEKKCYNLEIRLKDRWIDMLDGTLMEAENQNPSYRMLIDKKSRFPVQFTFYNGKNEIERQSTFEKIEVDKKPEDLTWNSQGLRDSYLVFTADEFQRRLVNSSNASVNNNAPLFELSTLNGNDFRMQSLDKPVVLVFWYPGCNDCSTINKLSRLKTEIPAVDILLAEITNLSESDVRAHIESGEIDLPVLINAKETASRYGIISAPTFVLIDKEGVIRYRGDELNEAQEKELIKSLSST